MVKTAKGVLVRTATPNPTQGGEVGGWSDSSSSDNSSDMEDDDAHIISAQPSQNSAAAGAGAQAPRSSSQSSERAYWLRRTLRAAIYGRVRYGILLRKLDPPVQVMLPGSSEWSSIEWEETDQSVAVKEMSWEHIRTQRDRLAEDPIKEVGAMQYLSQWLSHEQQQQKTMQLMQQLSVAAAAVGGNLDMNAQLAGNVPININGGVGYNAGNNNALGNNSQWIGQQQVPQAQAATVQNLSLYQTPERMLEAHIMMPMDLFSDNQNLYSIMPYCAGGELFDVLEQKNRFSEHEARYWMQQILKGLSCLKKAGVSHRDLSLENLLVHNGNVLVIDMGMCLRVPIIDRTSNQRYLILPQGVCGKWHYMSPEVCKNQLPFDGPAVDLWAAGVILFLMLTGFPPWERPAMTDERFKYMSNGYLVQMLTEWQVGLSADAMDLLQRMFWLDPTDRLSLEQVCAHPWMAQ